MNDPFSDPNGTREEILGAAFRALCEHGYAALTIQRIGDEFEKSPSLVYHHYDGKDDLLVDLLEFLLEGFEETVSGDDYDVPPRDRIDGYVLAMTDPASIDDEHAPDDRFIGAVVELRAQAAHDDAYRDHFDRSDRMFQSFLERAVREAAAAVDGGPVATDRDPDTADGIDDGIAAREVAATVQTLATGGTLRWATTDERDWVNDVRAGVNDYLDAVLPRVIDATEDVER